MVWRALSFEHSAGPKGRLAFVLDCPQGTMRVPTRSRSNPSSTQTGNKSMSTCELVSSRSIVPVPVSLPVPVRCGAPMQTS